MKKFIYYLIAVLWISVQPFMLLMYVVSGQYEYGEPIVIPLMTIGCIGWVIVWSALWFCNWETPNER